MCRVETLVVIFFSLFLFILPIPSVATLLDYAILIPIIYLFLTTLRIKKHYIHFLALIILISLPGVVISLNPFVLTLGASVVFLLYLQTTANERPVPYYNKLCLIAIIFSSIYLIDSEFWRVRGDGRFHLNHIDPNFSGVGVFLFFCLSMHYNKNRYAAIFFIISILLLSRAAFLSIALFYTLTKIKIIYNNTIYKVLTTNIGITAFFGILALFFATDTIQQLLGGFKETTSDGALRLISLADNSNIGRFMKFAFTFELMQNPEYFFIGPGTEIYGAIVPHNSLMFIFANYGLFAVLAQIVFLWSIKNTNIHQRALSSAMIFYSMFLHGLLLGLYFLVFLYIHHKLCNAKISIKHQ